MSESMMAPEESPVRVDFAAPSSLLRETHRASGLPILRNGPPGTFVVFPGGLRVSLPTDQIVWTDDAAGRASVGFGGMRFVGLEGERLTFVRERELHPEAQLSPDRSQTMYLDPAWVASVSAHGRPVWPTDADRGMRPGPCRK
jgi:hypothetical protein